MNNIINNHGFVFYQSYFIALEAMPDDMKLEALNAMLNYAFYGEAYEGGNGTVKMFYDLTKPTIDANIKNFENGKKGGRPKGVKTDS